MKINYIDDFDDQSSIKAWGMFWPNMRSQY